MKSELTCKLGFLSTVVAYLYIQDWFQDKLMKNRFLRTNLKKVFDFVTKRIT